VKKVVVVTPAFNEEKDEGRVVEKVLDVGIVKEIVFFENAD